MPDFYHFCFEADKCQLNINIEPSSNLIYLIIEPFQTGMIDNFIDEYESWHRVYTHPSGCSIFLGDINSANDPNFIRN